MIAFFLPLFAALLMNPTTTRSEECIPLGFSYLHDVDRSIVQDMRYYGPHNFMGRRVEGYNAPVCVLSTEAARALSLVQRKAEMFGKSLKVYDCYRPQRAVDDFVKWSNNPYDVLMKEEFYPTLDKADLFPNYIATKSGHTRGSTVDVTLVNLPLLDEVTYYPGQPLAPCDATLIDGRYEDTSLDFGTGFDCFSEVAATNSTAITDEQSELRQLLVDLMASQGFVNYAGEWWHFTLSPEPFPNVYFDFPIQMSCAWSQREEH